MTPPATPGQKCSSFSMQSTFMSRSGGIKKAIELTRKSLVSWIISCHWHCNIEHPILNIFFECPFSLLQMMSGLQPPSWQNEEISKLTVMHLFQCTITDQDDIYLIRGRNQICFGNGNGKVWSHSPSPSIVSIVEQKNLRCVWRNRIWSAYQKKQKYFSIKANL